MRRTSPARSRFRERLGYYLLGVAIGCVLLGSALASRQMSKRNAAQPPPATRTTP
jgi:hypothetical protein